MTPPRRLRLATLNCLNLSLPGHRPYRGVEPYGSDEYLAKTQWLAGMFDRLAADFVMVQEIFHEAALRDAVNQTAAGRGAHQLAAPLAHDTNDRPRVGLVWRAGWQPVLETVMQFPPGCAVDVPERGPYAAFSRPPLLARVPWAGSVLTLLNVHLKSRRPEYVGDEQPGDPVVDARAQLRSLLMRAAEAAALRTIVVGLTAPGASLVVAGDFNDEANAVTTRIVADTSCKDVPPVCGHVLYNTLDLAPPASPAHARDAAFTILHGGVPERIDHMFVSEPFVAGQVPRVARVVGVEIYNDHLAERQAHATGLVGGPDPARVTSDHAAVCTTVELL